MLPIKEWELHELSFDKSGMFNEINVETEFLFIDFAVDGELTCEQRDIISSFSFNTVVGSNSHSFYINKMHLELNQLNSGTKRKNIRNEKELEKALVSCVELDHMNSEERGEMVNLFINSVDVFIEELKEHEQKLRDERN
ncbi:hypothetical protein [Pseudalkalibacillus hwajinpoensis]|uniref:Uncharacterized protein n=1 Tax=Guptibacillus hwajinpoensis TaxID=208199 RepID=A0A4U1ML81_9BACL|nr:hypothetical protein [Pseudalkalibacillus hwajinpoensis]TKD71386.1 hypothetical protein FBF83_00830 [Pseudalkalibacillus hwajinpoensis]